MDEAGRVKAVALEEALQAGKTATNSPRQEDDGNRHRSPSLPPAPARRRARRRATGGRRCDPGGAVRTGRGNAAPIT
jgi:hypothetical protein